MVLCPVKGRNMVKRLGKGELLTATAAKKQRKQKEPGTTYTFQRHSPGNSVFPPDRLHLLPFGMNLSVDWPIDEVSALLIQSPQ